MVSMLGQAGHIGHAGLVLLAVATVCYRDIVSTKDEQMITVRIPVDLYEWLRRVAFRDRVSQATVVRDALWAQRHRERLGVHDLQHLPAERAEEGR